MLNVDNMTDENIGKEVDNHTVVAESSNVIIFHFHIRNILGLSSFGK